MRATRTVPMFVWALLAGLLAGGCAEEPPAPEPELRPVRVHRVSSRGLTRERSLAGVVRAGVESRLSFRVAGTIRDLDVRVGGPVRTGEVLARLDPIDYELRVEEAKAALAQAEASLRRAEADFERVRALYENDNASKAEYDAARAAAESAEAQVEARAKQLAQARRQLDHTTLRAPADGVIASVAVEVNENVDAGQEICLLIADGQPEVVVPVPEGMISSVEAGERIEVTIDALPGQIFAAEVSEVGVAVTGGATTYPVRARFVVATEMVRAGMTAEASFSIREGGGGRIFVPGVAVGEDREGRFVFVLEPGEEGEGTVRRRGVTIGATAGAGIEIVDGLAEDDLVVTAGVRRLEDGMRVLVQGVDGYAA